MEWEILRLPRTEEHILEDDTLLGEAEEIAVVRFVRGRCGERLLFNSCPGKVDVEEKEEYAETDY
jgi:hypothetical protein